MLDSLPLLFPSEFPAIARRELKTLQINLGYRCNLSCQHCHVDAGPKRSESMTSETVDAVLAFLDRCPLGTLDLTGGAPELNPHFRRLVREGRRRGMTVIDRCNLTILQEPGHEDLAGFLAEHGVRVIASLPCYLAENVEAQRGKGVFAASLEGLRTLNRHGYAEEGSGLVLDLVYNPQGATLPPPQCSLEAEYKQALSERYGIRFDHLLTITNMPIKRFGSLLQSTGQFDGYLALLKGAYREDNLDALMCRDLISVDWQGFLYDCDFNQMLGLGMEQERQRLHIADFDPVRLAGQPIRTGQHCFGCAAGQGSSCGGALA
ncbi:radical SAM protein [Thiocapsa imhoffii]|uniref:Radical SAM protein n=1 Tax=Thiocapsa imhoffii TaxID=382777 RepID=A0A9X1B8S2_9GAMM|nr:arsenosugar biosynthesis radical SAM (seleno)protein ArsS [Thiocapsa imhoffii]MBK1644345.1 radical SAM protein [Thiocapsa imhoffii]